MIPIPLLEPKRQATLSRALNIALDKRREALAEFPNWEAMRLRSREIRSGALDRLDDLLAQFERVASANGIRVVRAATAEEACQYVVEIGRRIGAASAVKVKSMVSEEIHLNRALEAAGIRPVETDLGEYVAQLNGQPPLHLTAPVEHLSRQEISSILAEKLGVP